MQIARLGTWPPHLPVFLRLSFGGWKMSVMNLCKIAPATLTLLQWDFCTNSKHTRVWWYFHLVFIKKALEASMQILSHKSLLVWESPSRAACLFCMQILNFDRIWSLQSLFSDVLLLSNIMSIINGKAVTVRNNAMNTNFVVLFLNSLPEKLSSLLLVTSHLMFPVLWMNSD